MTTSAIEILVLKQLEEIQSLRAQLADATRKLEAQPEVTGAVAYRVSRVHSEGPGALCDDPELLAEARELGCKIEPLYPPSAIDAAVREKLEEVVNMIEHTPSLKDPDDTARLIQNKVRALMESPQPSVEEPAN